MTKNSRRKHHSKKRGPSQEQLITAVFAELDEDALFLGPRLFEDKYYDDRIKLDLSLKRKKRGKLCP